MLRVDKTVNHRGSEEQNAVLTCNRSCKVGAAGDE